MMMLAHVIGRKLGRNSCLVMCQKNKLLQVCFTEKPHKLLGGVIHVSDQADGIWFVGCEFVKRMDNAVELLSRG